ncbi:MAG: carboxyltransferase domain-containing protein [Thermoanaerobaculia bacterium]
MRDLVEQLFMLAIHGCGRYHHAVHRVPAGDNAELIELGDVTAQELHAAAARVRAEEGVLACIVGHSSLYVIRGERGTHAPIATREPREVHVRVEFDGPDLPEHISMDRLAGLRLTVRYLGFRGGFAYLDGWPEEWAMPRRPTSRPVARGTFAVAGNVAGFYPIDTPGGWNLLGHTDMDLENALIPGDVVVIEPTSMSPLPAVRGEGEGEGRILRNSRPSPYPLPAQRGEGTFCVSVTAPDWSRVERGLPPGGPFDDVAAAVAMSAVRGDVELLECAMVGPHLRFPRERVIAWCTPDLELRVERVREGAFGRIEGGLRAYLAIGDAAQEPIKAQRRGDRHVIRVLPGPHDVGLHEIECEVTPQLNRVGIRLRPLRELRVDIPADLRSIGMQCGTVQLHPDGSLVAMGPDHPVTGGYLQPMTVITSERWKLAQLVPGERVTFRYEPNE